MDIKRLKQLAGTLTESVDLEEDVRQTTNALMTMMDEGILDPRTIADACLVYMSEDEVRDMARSNELPTSEEDLYGDEDEDEMVEDGYSYSLNDPDWIDKIDGPPGHEREANPDANDPRGNNNNTPSDVRAPADQRNRRIPRNFRPEPGSRESNRWA